MGTNIWGKGGLFEQRAAMAQKVDENQMANRTAATGIAQQNADSDTAFVNNRGVTEAFGADTERMKVDRRFDPETSGLRGLGKSAGGSGAATLFNQDGSVLGIRGSAVGAGSSTVPGLSAPLTNSFVKETQDSAPGDRAAATGSNSFTEKKPGFQKGGRVDTYSPKPGTTVHRLPRGLPRVIESPGARDVPRTDKEMERDRQMAEQAIDEGMQRGAAKFANPKYPDDAKGMRGFKCGGKVSHKPKLNQPGYAKGGKIMMPPEAPGAIGDVEMDTGMDTEEVAVRPGEYLLNPETVAFLGQGNYEQGVRQLNQLVQQATGEEPGPEPVGKSQGGEEMMGFRDSGEVESQRVRAARARIGKAEAAKLERQLNIPPEQRRTLSPEAKANLQEPTGTRPATMQEPVVEAPKNGRIANARAAISGKNTTTIGDTLRGAKEGGAKVVRGAKNIGPGLLRTAPVGFGIEGAVRGLNTDTEEYRRRFGMETDDPSLLGDMGVRTMGVATDIGASALDTAMLPYNATVHGTDFENWKSYRDNFADVADANAQREAGTVQAQAQDQDQAQAQTEAPPAAYGRAFGAGDVQLPTTGLRSASEAVAPGGMNVVQNTGGPNGEMIIREDINGVPTFSNVRRGGFDGSAANLQKEADARVAEDYATGLRNQKVMDQMREAAPAYTDREAAIRRDDANALRLAEIEASGRGTPAKPLNLRKELEQQFTRPVMDDNGDVKDYIPDPEQIKVFESVLSQLNPAIMQKYGVPFHELPLEERQNVYRDYTGVLNDTIAGQQAERASGRPTSMVPRTGERGLRVVPDSNISLGDVWGPEFTLGDYTAGLFNGNDTNDLQVEDYSGARMPLRRLLKQNAGAEREALARYGYFDNKK